VTSRLDFHIAQKTAQRDSLDYAARRLRDRPGVILEVGLGKGRSYSHLRAAFPGHEILCFDRKDHAHRGWGPPPGQLLLGDLAEVLARPVLTGRLAGRVLLAHLDLARGDEAGGEIQTLVVSRIHPWLRPDALVLSDRPVALETAGDLVRLDLRGEVAHAELFYVYGRAGAHPAGPGSPAAPA
jgi:hypothetical protein